MLLGRERLNQNHTGCEMTVSLHVLMVPVTEDTVDVNYRIHEDPCQSLDIFGDTLWFVIR